MKIFWSWQSDTHGKTGRHFVREAIAQAIKKLKEAEDIDEPPEREKVEKLHLDHDRQGVPGSPDLASTIFSKVKNSVVFIADVTPVAELERAIDGKKETKKIMNPNVAIELGYALHALGDNSILMIMNTYYGDRKDLPFDLAHKAGPITYHLLPDADKAKIEAQRNLLSNSIAEALRPYLTAPTPKEEKFEERIKRQKVEIEAKEKKDAFIASENAAYLAGDEAKNLLDIIEEKCILIDQNIQKKRINSFTLCLFYKNFGYSIVWERKYSNTLDEAELVLTIWKGVPPQWNGMALYAPQLLQTTRYKFDCDMDLKPGWATGVGIIKPLENEAVAEHCIKFFMDCLHNRKMKD